MSDNADINARMEILARRIADSGWPLDVVEYARAIVAELPEPIDPDLIEAREICAIVCEEQYGGPGCMEAQSYREGNHDSDPEVQRALAAIKRGSQQ